ncbi:MAG TPA: hypothetical protein VFG69_11615 [Nannocystaceae bacterium]|nr:hypothetical protein [Nannocystaceae bacterium]
MKKLAQIVLAGSVGILSLGCGASPEAVCDHMIDLMKKELGEEAAKAVPREECVKEAEHDKEMGGMMKWRTQANCVMDAQKLDDAMKCDK